MKKYLLLGFISLLPIALTIIVVVWLFDFFTAPFVGIMETILLTFEKDYFIEQHQALLIFISRVMSLVFLFILVFFLGFFGRKYFFNTLMRWMNHLFRRIPFVKTVYRVSDEITKAVFTSGEKAFKSTVLVPFPTPKTHAMGFITGNVPEALKKVIVDAELSVFVPTAPHPLSGFMLMSAKKELLDVDISVEDGFKYLISCGTIHPGQEIPKEKSE